MIRPSGVSHIGFRTGDLDRFVRFYEDVVGVAVQISFGPDGGRAGVMAVGDDTILAFEAGPGDPRPAGLGLDHIGFSVPDETAMHAVRDRLVAAGASAGAVRPEGPLLAVDFVDPDGTRGEINCLNPTFEPTVVPDLVVADPAWHDRTRRILTATA